MEDPPKHPEVAAIFARLLIELGVSGNQLAKALNTSQQVISGYTSGRTNPGREMLAAIIRRYPAINAAWLTTGEGEPFPDGRFNQKPAPVAEPAADYTSANSTEQTLYISVLKEQVADLKADKSRLLEENTDLRDEVKLLLGKPFDSSEAADARDEAPTDPHAPTFAGGALPQPWLRVNGLVRYDAEVAELSE